MEIELVGPVDALQEGHCNGCGYPPIQNLNTGHRKNGKVWKMITKTGAIVRLCKGCLWELRQQMKGILR